METNIEANLPSDKQMIDSVKGVVCQNCCRLLDSKDVSKESLVVNVL